MRSRTPSPAAHQRPGHRVHRRAELGHRRLPGRRRPRLARHAPAAEGRQANF
jgi:hypothetical protein